MFHPFNFSINMVGNAVDPKISEKKHNFIYIAISGGLPYNLTGLLVYFNSVAACAVLSSNIVDNCRILLNNLMNMNYQIKYKPIAK